MQPPEIIRRRRLPHWDVSDATYFVTTCLEGSIAAQGLLDIERYRAELERRRRPTGRTESEWRQEQWKRAFARTELWLDRKPGVRHLADPRLAQVVVDALFFFAGQRYDLIAFAVMPSHLHWVFRPLGERLVHQDGRRARSARERIIHSLNRFTALECNRLRASKGRFWQHESYDHWVRDEDELERIIAYVEGNPVKAGLAAMPEDWPFSSARYRQPDGRLIRPDWYDA